MPTDTMILKAIEHALIEQHNKEEQEWSRAREQSPIIKHITPQQLYKDSE